MIGSLATLSTMVIGSSVFHSAGGSAGSVASGHPATSLLFLRIPYPATGPHRGTDWWAPKTYGSAVRVSISVGGVAARSVWGRQPSGITSTNMMKVLGAQFAISSAIAHTRWNAKTDYKLANEFCASHRTLHANLARELSPLSEFKKVRHINTN